MTWTVYGIRQRGSTQVRYIGQTNQGMFLRIAAHIQSAATKPYLGVHHWIAQLADPERDAEVFALTTHSDRRLALASERELIGAYAHAGHQLLNVRCNPLVKEKRAVWPRNKPTKRARHKQAATS